MGIFEATFGKNDHITHYEDTFYLFCSFGKAMSFIQKVNIESNTLGITQHVVEQSFDGDSYYAKVLIDNRITRSTYLKDEPDNGRVLVKIGVDIAKGRASLLGNLYKSKILSKCKPDGRVAITSSNSDDYIDKLFKLKQLFDSGVITEQEFELKKAEIININNKH